MKSKPLDKPFIISAIIVFSFILWICIGRFFNNIAYSESLGCRSEGTDWGQQIKCANSVLQGIYDFLYTSNFDMSMRFLLSIFLFIPALIFLIHTLITKKY